MKKPEKSKDPRLGELRMRAEAAFKERGVALGAPPVDGETVLYELQVHQIELDMQLEELKRAQDELQQARDRYAALFRTAPVGYFTLSGANVITLANDAGAAMLGASPARLAGLRFSLFVSADFLTRFDAHRQDAAASGKAAVELEMTRLDGEKFWASLQSRGPIAGSELLVVVADMSARKQAENALNEAQTKLQSTVRVLQAEAERRKMAEHELRDLAHRLVSAHEEERSHIARELHDQLGQLLTYLQMILGQDDAALLAGGTALGETRKILDQALTLVRDLSAELRPPLLEELGLAPALRRMVKQFSKRTGMDVICEVPDTLPLPYPTALAAFRIVQEALTNAARHAATKEARVTVHLAERALAIEVRDEGRGFDVGRVGQSLGLLGMKERALAAGGTLTIDSAMGKGTLVSAKIPVAQA